MFISRKQKEEARSQKRFDLFILFLTALLWLYLINGIVNELIK